MTRRNLTIFLLVTGLCSVFLLVSPVVSADIYTDIDDHLQHNRVSEARNLIETALVDRARDHNLYLRLAAIAEYQGDYREAIVTLESGLEITDTSTEVFYYNIGNNYFALRQYDDAERAYSMAIKIEAAYEPSYINRANARVWNENYIGAIEDYTHYLTIAPQGKYRTEVKRMIAILRETLRAEEAREREQIAREKKLLQDALFLLGSSHNDGLNSRSPSANIDELDDALDIVD